MTKVTQRGRHSGTGTGSGRSRASRRRLFIFRFSGSMGPAVRSRCQLDDWLSTVNERLFQRFYCENGDSFTAAAASFTTAETRGVRSGLRAPFIAIYTCLLSGTRYHYV